MISLQIPPLANSLKVELQRKIDFKTKPLGALGMLETIALQIGLIQDTLAPQLIEPTMLVFAGDHGIAESGVSPYPQAVTAQMVLNFINGGAAINVFCKLNGVKLLVVDSGVNHVFAPHAYLIDAKIAMGTASYLVEAAMTPAQCEQALTVGKSIANKEISSGCNVMAFGEMGIGNTSSASCLMSVICCEPIENCVGRGTGLDDAGVLKKTALLAKAISHHNLNGNDPIKALQTFGGFEIAMMTGAMLGAAERKTILLIDGFIASAALLVASKLQPTILDYCIFAHSSDEKAHKKMLNHLGAKPLLDMGLRLGEGTGAALAYPFLEAAVNFLNDMASFESAGVSEKIDA